ncbi:MAG: phosphoglycerate dehydrogenase [Erysipelotrichaceae bacterium]|nr:phosphoglycerate dehydrogenase [Erysipelotrichaceae bacterium]
MKKIRLANRIDENGLAEFSKDYQYGEDITEEDGILVRSASLHEYEFPESLLAISRAGAGVNNIPIQKCSDQGIVVFNTPGANANAVKEIVICSLFLASRDITGGMEWEKQLADSADFAKAVEKGKSAFVGPEISGKKLGVIGLGAIGVLVANAAVKLGMEVYGYDPYISVNNAWALSKWVKHVTNISELYGECDYITIHIPFTEETRNTINEETLNQMKDGVRILNFARGELVDEQALLKALEDGKVARYITDFGSYRLAHSDKVVCLPHLGASTPESEENCARMAVRELQEYLDNGNIYNSVNFPAIMEPRTTSHRICIIHKNVPNMLAQLTTVVGTSGINIENMANKARGEVAYTIIDTESYVDVQQFADIENVIRVRVIGE